MQKLTLPIVVGKKYVRRDGEVITAQQDDSFSDIAKVGDEHTVWKENGKRYRGCLSDQMTPTDLVADYTEPVIAHPHAEAMMEYAKDAASMAEPWKNWESKGKFGDWLEVPRHPEWNVEREYRRKQPKVTTNGIIVNKGVDEVEYMREYFVCSLTRPEKFFTTKHAGVYLKNGIVHATEEDAIAMAKAMLSFK